MKLMNKGRQEVQILLPGFPGSWKSLLVKTGNLCFKRPGSIYSVNSFIHSTKIFGVITVYKRLFKGLEIQQKMRYKVFTLTEHTLHKPCSFLFWWQFQTIPSLYDIFITPSHHLYHEDFLEPLVWLSDEIQDA